MADVKQQIIDKLKDSSNVLVTVNTNPSVDELSAALGITLLLNKLNKHATAVFSGDVPPAIEFLEPEKTFENTVDSLRDFIIALDKEKADHLRYKVVDDMVKIFITPYRTTISENDLDFSQGDYNVEAVLAIGVKSEDDLDKALSSHGKILHDATVAAISLGEATNLGGIELVNKSASSYSEMLVDIAQGLKSDKNLIDEQIATAFLTGIVAATDRFSNNKTTSNVMTVAAQLMSAGANQQLIAVKLQEGRALSNPGTTPIGEVEKSQPPQDHSDEPEVEKNTTASDGSLAISHVPEGSVEEVAKELADEKSKEAVVVAEERLASESASHMRSDETIDTVSNMASAKTDGPNVTTPPIPDAQEQRHASVDDSAEPSMGGTLNATTEQAAIDKQRQIDDDRNRTILTHGGENYVKGTPTFQAPLNAAISGDQEPSVPDILSTGGSTAVTDHAALIQPPAPSSVAPTLAEIDEQNRTHHDTAIAAVNAALENPDVATVSAPTPSSSTSGVPLPPLPPMPDFSTLPPLPGALNATSPQEGVLGDVLPPLEPIGAIGSGPQSIPDGPIPGTPVDPAQYRIPGAL